jgi:hypothetical protein
MDVLTVSSDFNVVELITLIIVILLLLGYFIPWRR